ncbi:MAG: 30S ribosomal protein S21 [Candidatus Uhrbacteria bacterium]|nr:30S ribosomal protein S21 [Candidatus Uhrbacteria bacterium]
MPEVRRKQKESYESLLRRFSKNVQQSGKLLEVRKKRYYSPLQSDSKKKKTAMRRLTIEGKKEFLRKTGKLKDNKFPGTKALMKL